MPDAPPPALRGRAGERLALDQLIEDARESRSTVLLCPDGRPRVT